MSQQIVRHVYNTYDEFLDYVEWEDESITKNEHRSSLEDEGSSWSGTTSLSDALNLAKYGWDAGLDEIKKIIPDIKFQNCVVDSINKDVTGSYIDIDAFIHGIPECMYNFNSYNFAKYIKIFVNITANAGVNKNQIYERGKIVLSAIDTMESKNIRCEVWAIETTGGDDSSRYYIEVKVKDYNERLNIEKLNFVLCNPAFLRRLCFSEAERNPSDIKSCFGFAECGSYGRAVNEYFPTEDKVLYIPCVSDVNYDEIKKEIEEICGAKDKREDKNIDTSCKKTKDLYVGKYYKWIGPKGTPKGWNDKGKMDAMLDGKPRKYIIGGMFEGIDGGWQWLTSGANKKNSEGYLKYFVEVEGGE